MNVTIKIYEFWHVLSSEIFSVVRLDCDPLAVTVHHWIISS